MRTGASFNDRNEIVAPRLVSRRPIFSFIAFVLIGLSLFAIIMPTQFSTAFAKFGPQACSTNPTTSMVTCSAPPVPDKGSRPSDKDQSSKDTSKNNNSSNKDKDTSKNDDSKDTNKDSNDDSSKDSSKNDDSLDSSCVVSTTGTTTCDDDVNNAGNESKPKNKASDDVSNDNFWNNLMCGASGDLGWNTQYTIFQEPLFDDGLYTSKWSIQNLYGGSIKWTTYNGTRSPKYYNKEAGKIIPLKGQQSGNVAAPDYVGKGDIDNARKASDSVHTAGRCVMNGLINMIAMSILQMAEGVADLISFFVAQAVNPAVICQSPKGGVGCINLLAAIGGDGIEGGNEGIIGRLYSGLYLGLTVVAFGCVGLWMLWNGIVKRRYRMAMSGLAWSFAIFIIGVIIGTQPLMVAQAPMRVATTLGACVIQSMNGVNCLSNTSKAATTEDGTAKDKTECYIDTNQSDIGIDQMLAIEAKQSSCIVWRAFVLNPWSMGQFGKPYDELYTKDTILIKNLKDAKKADYWKNIKVSLNTDGDNNPMMVCQNASGSKWTYSNIAIYQLDLQSSVHDCTGSKFAFLAKAAQSQNNAIGVAANLTQRYWAPKGSNAEEYHSSAKVVTDAAVYADWYYMIDLMSQVKQTNGTGDKDVSDAWYWWSGEKAMGRIKVAIIALVATIAAAFILITTALLAIMYLVSGTILTAFAPLFCLFGIVPGQGKRIFLGYLEQLFSSVLKYLACILWMIVTIEVFGAVLSTEMGLGSSILFIIIVTTAMWMYRKEFINMIGRCNMGGQQLTNHVGNYMKQKATQMGRRGLAIGNAAVGATVASAMAGESGANMRNTVVSNVVNEMSRGTGTLAQTTRAATAISERRKKLGAKQLDRTYKKVESTQNALATKIQNDYKVDPATVKDANAAAQQIDARFQPQINDAKTEAANVDKAYHEMADARKFNDNMSSDYTSYMRAMKAAQAPNATQADKARFQQVEQGIIGRYAQATGKQIDSSTLSQMMRNGEYKHAYDAHMYDTYKGRADNLAKKYIQDHAAQFSGMDAASALAAAHTKLQASGDAKYQREIGKMNSYRGGYRQNLNDMRTQMNNIMSSNGVNGAKYGIDGSTKVEDMVGKMKQASMDSVQAVTDIRNERDAQKLAVGSAIDEYNNLDTLRKTVANNKEAFRTSTSRVKRGDLEQLNNDYANINTEMKRVKANMNMAHPNDTHGTQRAASHAASAASVGSTTAAYQNAHGLDSHGTKAEWYHHDPVTGRQELDSNYQDATDHS